MREFWKVTVERIRESDEDDHGNRRERSELVYMQRVNELDLGAVIDAANITELSDRQVELEHSYAARQ